MKKFNLITLIFAVFMSFCANSSEKVQIATIDIEQISKEAKVVKDIAEQIGAKRDKFQKDITKQEQKLEKEKDKLDAKKSVLSDSALKEEQAKFFKKVEKLKSDASKKDKILKKAYTESIKKVNDIVGEVVDEVSKEKGLLIVLPTSQVVYSVKGVNITDEVVSRLDKRIDKLRVKFD